MDSQATIDGENILINTPAAELTVDRYGRISVLYANLLDRLIEEGEIIQPAHIYHETEQHRRLHLLRRVALAYLHEHHLLADNPEAEIREPDVRASAISNLLTPATADSLVSQGRRCIICFEDFEETNDNPVSLPCGHVFGEVCIISWLAENVTCPYCRRDYGELLEGPEDLLAGYWIIIIE